jgi:hypothetical protein
MDNIVKFPGSSDRAPVKVPDATEWGPDRSCEAVQRDIDEHIDARKNYCSAVAWQAALQHQENATPAALDGARQEAETRYRLMVSAARNLLICMSTDIRGLVDLLMYMEKNFTVLPPEIVHYANGGGQSLAFDLLKTARLSLREIREARAFAIRLKR